MKLIKAYDKCRLCQREISISGFNKHLERHFNPTSRLCNFWYKSYFKKDRGVLVCTLCDEEIHPDFKMSKMEHEEHLAKRHNITKPTN